MKIRQKDIDETRDLLTRFFYRYEMLVAFYLKILKHNKGEGHKVLEVPVLGVDINCFITAAECFGVEKAVFTSYKTYKVVL